MKDHPMKNLDVLVYFCPEAVGENRYRAFFDSPTTPIYFSGRTSTEARDRAVAFKKKAVAYNEAAYRVRCENLAKGRAKRAAK